MLNQIIVDIPYNKEISYTLYAKGMNIENPSLDNNEDFIHYKFANNSVVVLYYTFTGFRRAYVVTAFDEDKAFTTPVTLPGIDIKLNVLFVAKGRRIDYLKRAIYLLTKKDQYKIFTYPHVFWYKLCSLIQFHGAKKSDLYLLNKQFSKEAQL